ncbi:MAG TPA: hypothetical protein VMF66_12510 [Candidatus Acidoferrum sp.]|nr:hypothetical protein [Candidatus Acidoferrum sp.]
MKPVLWILLLSTAEVIFPAKNSRTLRQRYKEPVARTFLVRPGVVARASFGKSGNTCELVIKRGEGSSAIKGDHANDVVGYKLLEQIENELVPLSDRGKYVMGTFLDLICIPVNDCAGTEEDWKKVSIYTNSGDGGANYALIHWNRKECGKRLPFAKR